MLEDLHSGLLLVFCSLIISTRAHESSGLTIEVPDQEEVCFYEDFEGSRNYNFAYKVIKGGNYDIDVAVVSPRGEEIFNRIRSSEDEFKFEISWGTYKFCFSNEISTVTHKLVYFELRPEGHVRLAFEGGKKGPTANTQAEEALEEIHSAASQVMDFQVKYRLAEAKARNDAENLNWSVQYYSMLQAVVILVVGLTELLILKTFFTEKRSLVKTSQNPLYSPTINP